MFAVKESTAQRTSIDKITPARALLIAGNRILRSSAKHNANEVKPATERLRDAMEGDNVANYIRLVFDLLMETSAKIKELIRKNGDLLAELQRLREENLSLKEKINDSSFRRRIARPRRIAVTTLIPVPYWIQTVIVPWSCQTSQNHLAAAPLRRSPTISPVLVRSSISWTLSAYRRLFSAWEHRNRAGLGRSRYTACQ